MVKVISLGGSIVAPDQVDILFLKEFFSLIETYLDEKKERKLIFVIGGGGPARAYQKAYREIISQRDATPDADLQDWIGIAATRLNGELIRALFGNRCKEPLVIDPSVAKDFSGQVLIAAGWKPGFSTDFDAVILGEKFGATTVINLSNISKVYSDDPKLNPDAVPIDKISWNEFQKLVGTEWVPGKNVPFDPIATAKAAELSMQVIVAGGRDIPNLKLILEEKLDSFTGTIIG